MVDVDTNGLKAELVEIYQSYIKEPENKKAKEMAREIYNRLHDSTVIFDRELAYAIHLLVDVGWDTGPNTKVLKEVAEKIIRNLSTEKIRVHLFVEGKVHDVSFRSSTKREADKLGLTGWVKNLEDWRVEIITEGEKEIVQKLVDFCKKGPPRAKVERVEVVREAFSGEFEKFEVVR